MKRTATLLMVLSLLAWGPMAHACSVCGAGVKDRSREAFFNTTLLLSFLPLGMIGGGLWWLRGKVRDRYPDEFAHRD